MLQQSITLTKIFDGQVNLHSIATTIFYGILLFIILTFAILRNVMVKGHEMLRHHSTEYYYS